MNFGATWQKNTQNVLSQLAEYRHVLFQLAEYKTRTLSTGGVCDVLFQLAEYVGQILRNSFDWRSTENVLFQLAEYRMSGFCAYCYDRACIMAVSPTCARLSALNVAPPSTTLYVVLTADGRVLV